VLLKEEESELALHEKDVDSVLCHLVSDDGVPGGLDLDTGDAHWSKSLSQYNIQHWWKCYN
jgi:hypothetical protein